MFTRKSKALACVALALALAAATHAQAQAQPDLPPSDNYVSNTGFKNRVFEVRNRTPGDLIPILKVLTSGFKGAQVSASNEFRTITVRDFPENIATIEDALKRLDTPEAARPDIELRMHVLIASNTETTLSQYPADLKDVITQLQATLNYKNYYLLTSIVQRTKERRGYHPGFLRGSGSAQAANAGGEKQDFNYGFEANSLDLTQTGAGTTAVQLGGFDFQLAGSSSAGSAHIRSDVSMREGERVVVGTAGLRDRALILVMTAKSVK